jgi:hypothetical protein
MMGDVKRYLKIRTDRQLYVRIGFNAILAAALIALAATSGGCAGPPDEIVGDDEPADPATPVEPAFPAVEPPIPVEPEPMPEPEPEPEPEPSLVLTFDGPPAGTEIGVGAKDADVLCFSATSNRDVYVWNLRFRISAFPSVEGGLVYDVDQTPNYSDIKVVDAETGMVVAGPRDLSGTCSDGLQHVEMYDPFLLETGVPRSFCVRLDAMNRNVLDGETVSVMLLPFAERDIRYADDSSMFFPVENVEPAGGLSSSFALKAPSPPVVSQLPLPTSVMNDGTNILARVTYTATEEDVFLKKLSFPVSRMYLPLPGMSNPAIRVVGSGTDLPAASAVVQDGSPGCGYGPTGPSIACIKFVFDDELGVAAGTSVTMEVRVTLTGVTDSSITTCLPFDLQPASGPLTGSGTDTEIDDLPLVNRTYHTVWTNDLVTYRNGYQFYPGCNGWILSH